MRADQMRQVRARDPRRKEDEFWVEDPEVVYFKDEGRY
jgi:hypothetical protein